MYEKILIFLLCLVFYLLFVEDFDYDSKTVKDTKNQEDSSFFSIPTIKHHIREASSGVPSSWKRNSYEDVIEHFRKLVEDKFIAQEISVETIVQNYHQNSELLVYRFCGPSGTGKTLLSCFLANSIFESTPAFDASRCLLNEIDTSGPIISVSFRSDDNDELSVVSEYLNEVNNKANDRLKLYPDGVVIILNDFNLAGPSIWTFLKALSQQESMKNSVVILTDDLSSDTSDKFRSQLGIRIDSSTTSFEEAKSVIFEEIKNVFPKDYSEISGKDIWIPFLPFTSSIIELFIQRLCKNTDQALREKMNFNFSGRLLCEMRRVTQASLKLSKCVDLRGARALVNTFRNAFISVLDRRTYCSASNQTFEECLMNNHSPPFPSRSIVFEVLQVEDQVNSCSEEAMQSWISFHLAGSAHEDPFEEMNCGKNAENEVPFRNSPKNVVKTLRNSIDKSFISQELAVETIIQEYRESSKILVYRFCGPSGTGKTFMACFLASSMFGTAEDISEICQNKGDLGPRVISITFSKGGEETSVMEYLNEVNNAANEKLKKFPSGIAIILNDYNLAGPPIWTFLKALTKQENMKNSVIILTDDLSPEAADIFKSKLKLRLDSSLSDDDAKSVILQEIKNVFPKEFTEISGNDVWVPFLPFHLRAIESMIQNLCESSQIQLKRKIKRYIGRLVCERSTLSKAGLKLSQCVNSLGARVVVNVFRNAFFSVLMKKEYCASANQTFEECLQSEKLPFVQTKSISFEVKKTGYIQDESCTQESIESWIYFEIVSV